MAVCNVLGSNVFNILLGLGLPWLIAASMAGEPYVAGGGDVMEPLLILFGYLVMFIVIVAAFGWRLTPGMGYATTTSTARHLRLTSSTSAAGICCSSSSSATPGGTWASTPTARGGSASPTT